MYSRPPSSDNQVQDPAVTAAGPPGAAGPAPTAKLTPAQVQQILQWHQEGITHKALLRKIEQSYDVAICQSTLRNLLSGRTYKRLQPAPPEPPRQLALFS